MAIELYLMMIGTLSVRIGVGFPFIVRRRDYVDPIPDYYSSEDRLVVCFPKEAVVVVVAHNDQV